MPAAAKPAVAAEAAPKSAPAAASACQEMPKDVKVENADKDAPEATPDAPLPLLDLSGFERQEDDQAREEARLCHT